tara:strand:- start:436 stop:900 length:465 start_codon:yes stop_codon:yes gene_type:complete
MKDLNGDNYSEIKTFPNLIENLNKFKQKHYFVNVYETKENIEYNYLSSSITDENPADIEICRQMPCMHPQFGYHVNVLEAPVELSMEFTIPANKIQNQFELVKVYVIDVEILLKNRHKTFPEFKAIEAIVLETTTFNSAKSNTSIKSLTRKNST